MRLRTLKWLTAGGFAMDAMILAAGAGRRMGSVTDGIPKLFLEISGRTLYDRHLEALEYVVERVLVVLGYGFIGDGSVGRNPSFGGVERAEFAGSINVATGEFNSSDGAVNDAKIGEYLATDRDVMVDALVVPHWDRYDNAETCRLGLAQMDDSVLLLNCDVVYKPRVLVDVVDTFRADYEGADLSCVAVKGGLQKEMTAVRWDANGLITEFGAITGHQVAGIFVIHRKHLSEARRVLGDHPGEWAPMMLPHIDTGYVAISPTDHREINTPAHLTEAERAVSTWEQTD